MGVPPSPSSAAGVRRQLGTLEMVVALALVALALWVASVSTFSVVGFDRAGPFPAAASRVATPVSGWAQSGVLHPGPGHLRATPVGQTTIACATSSSFEITPALLGGPVLPAGGFRPALISGSCGCRGPPTSTGLA